MLDPLIGLLPGDALDLATGNYLSLRQKNGMNGPLVTDAEAAAAGAKGVAQKQRAQAAYAAVIEYVELAGVIAKGRLEGGEGLRQITHPQSIAGIEQSSIARLDIIANKVAHRVLIARDGSLFAVKIPTGGTLIACGRAGTPPRL